jgi:Mg/Co/Ni transporter MgtE
MLVRDSAELVVSMPEEERRPWLRRLSALFLGEMLPATVLGFFEHEIAQAVVLALFIPIASAAVEIPGPKRRPWYRAVALGEVRLRHWLANL